MKNLLVIFPFLVTALGCGGSQPASATPQSGGRISVSPEILLSVLADLVDGANVRMI